MYVLTTFDINITESLSIHSENQTFLNPSHEQHTVHKLY